MKKLIFMLLVAVAAWYGWKHWGELTHRGPAHEAVIENASGMTMERVRLTVDGQTFVKEEIPNEQKVAFKFNVTKDASFKLVWEWKEKLGEASWAGGMVPRGPMVQRHLMQVDAENGVTYTAENR